MRVLINRNDKLGDFVLSLPCYQVLKTAIPDAKISVFVNEYTSELASSCPWIDELIIDKYIEKPLRDIQNLSSVFKCYNFNSIVTLFSTTRVAYAAFLARIPYRLAPATKFAQVFYNHRLVQKRSRSEKPEFEYNLDLIRRFLIDHGIKSIPEAKPPFLKFDENQVTSQKHKFCNQFKIAPTQKLVFLHAGSGGSANNLNLNQYAKLTRKLKSESGYTIILTAGPNEYEIATKLSNLILDLPHIVYHSTEGLIKFAQHIAFADLFIAGSTGPLHIAGALNVPTAAFYTRRRSATPLRWQTLNTPDRRLAFTPPETADEMDMSQIDIDEAARQINEKFLRD